MIFPRIIRNHVRMNGCHQWCVQLSEHTNSILVIASTEEDAMEIARLTHECKILQKKNKELEKQLSNQQPEIEHIYAYVPT